MSEIYKEGLSKAIGVSNFYPDRLVDFCLHNEIKPMLNQVECHPFHQQNSAQNTMNKLGIIMQLGLLLLKGIIIFLIISLCSKLVQSMEKA